LRAAQLPALRQRFARTKGIIVDMRGYPLELIREPLTACFQDQPKPFASERGVDPTYPGHDKPLPTMVAEPGSEPPYAGQLLLLVNEQTQSEAEFITMALRTTPHARVVGSQTAGTDGNVVAVYLPGGVRTQITTLGEYYPDGQPTQRVGVHIDVLVQPTLAGLSAGRDEVLEEALQLIELTP